MIFVEFLWFRQRVRAFLSEEALRQLQNTLVENPRIAPVIPECGGLRKLRWHVAGRGKGKRGGCRIIYLHHPQWSRIDLVAIYGKDEQDSLSPSQKRELSALTETLKREVNVSNRKRKQR